MTIEEKKKKLDQINQAIKAGSQKRSAIEAAGITKFQYYSWSKDKGLKQNQVYKKKQSQPSLVPVHNYAVTASVPPKVLIAFMGSPEQVVQAIRSLQ